jgi:four helix bundle protein
MFPFENLVVYQKAFELNRKIYRLLKTKNNLPSCIKSQLGQACLSIVLNIAEGSGKFHFNDRKKNLQ